MYDGNKPSTSGKTIFSLFLILILLKDTSTFQYSLIKGHLASTKSAANVFFILRPNKGLSSIHQIFVCMLFTTNPVVSEAENTLYLACVNAPPVPIEEDMRQQGCVFTQARLKS